MTRTIKNKCILNCTLNNRSTKFELFLERIECFRRLYLILSSLILYSEKTTILNSWPNSSIKIFFSRWLKESPFQTRFLSYHFFMVKKDQSQTLKQTLISYFHYIKLISFFYVYFLYKTYFNYIYCLLKKKVLKYLVQGPGVRKNLSVIDSYTRIQFKVNVQDIMVYLYLWL